MMEPVRTDNNNDSILGRRIFLNGIMADVSPSAVCGQLFATSLKVGNLLSGNLLTATQSDLEQTYDHWISKKYGHRKMLEHILKCN